jgi:hypothetical protein
MTHGEPGAVEPTPPRAAWINWIAQHPWWVFWPIALAYSLTGAERTNTFALLGAMLVLWASDRRERVRRSAGPRIAAFLGVLAACMALHWGAGIDRDNLASALPGAVVLAFALSSYFSPTAALRELVQSLLRFRVPLRAYLVAVLPWLLAVVLADLLWARPVGFASVDDARDWLHIALAGAASALLLALPEALAWYGFVAARLRQRLSPLASAFLVGPVPMLAVLVPDLRHGLPLDYTFWALVSAFSVAVIALWLLQQESGSLAPVVVFLFAVYWTPTLDLLMLGSTSTGLGSMLVAAHVLIALALAIQGRMWRRPDAGRRPVPAEEGAGA